MKRYAFDRGLRLRALPGPNGAASQSPGLSRWTSGLPWETESHTSINPNGGCGTSRLRYFVRLLVDMLEPYEGRVYDPCCGSGGMFVQSEKFIDAHTTDNGSSGKAKAGISVYWKELCVE